MARKFEILIVDDDVGLAANLQDILEAGGYSAAVAHDGQTALALCREKVFDLAIIDIKLPDISGTELIRKLTELSAVTDYIISTGYASLDSAIEAFKLGNIIAYETKPLNMDQLPAIIRQVAERKKAEEELRESEERYRALLNLGAQVGEAVVMVQDNEQVDGAQTLFNDEWPRITGYSREELLSMSFFDLLHPKDREASRDRHRRKMQGESMPGLFEMSIIRKDGNEVPIELTSAHTTYKGQRANVAYIRDITERKQAEEELEARAHMLDNASDTIVVRDFDGNFIYVNEAACRSLGYTKEELLGMNIFNIVVPEDAKSIEPRLKQLRETGAIIHESANLSKNKTVIPVEVHSQIIKWGNRELILSIVRDITKRKQRDEKERQLQQQLYLSGRLASIGELAAGVAHELNNPLTGILGFSERLLRKCDEEARPDLARIHSEAKRAANTVQNLLTFARQREPKKEYSDINDILQKALELRAYELKTSTIEVITDLAPSLPKVMVDFYQIEEVFLNIILNAEQAMVEAKRGGKLIIKTEVKNSNARVSFTDDGPGIPDEHLDKLFDPFFTTRRESGGTGLGLSICHGIVTEHGGRIYARSKPGKGTTFIVELPLTAENIN